MLSTDYSPNVPKAAVPGSDQFPHSPKKDKSALHLLKEHPEAKSGEREIKINAAVTIRSVVRYDIDTNTAVVALFI
jgi:hypothetical protein